MPAPVLHPSTRRPWSARPAKAVLGVLCGLMLGVALPTAAQDTSQPLRWQALGGPAGRISEITVDDAGEEAYAVSVARVRRKDDQTEWLANGNQISAYALYHSQDGGENWQPATNNLPPGPITAVYQDPVTGAVYVGLQGNGDSGSRRYGLWRSRDHGASWEQVGLGRDDLVIRSITRGAVGKGLYLGAMLATKYPTSYVYRSDDDGNSWSAVEALHFEQAPGSVLDRLIADRRDPVRLYITTQGGEVYTSADRGQSWSLPAAPPGALVPGRSYTSRLASAADSPTVMLLARGGDGGTSLLIDHSNDNGAHWSRQLASGLPAQGSVNAFVALQGGIFLLNLSTGTYRSADRGVTWQALEGPLSSGQVTAFAFGPAAATHVLAATAYGLFISRDSGALWQPVASGLPVNSSIAGLLTDAQHPELAYAISDDGGFLLHSADKGRTWSPAARALPPLEPLAWTLDPADSNTIYIGSYGRLYRSNDAGANWQIIPFDSAGVYAVSAVAVAPSDSKVIYVGGRPLQRSSDGGRTWRETPVIRAKETGQAEDVVGLIIDPGNSDHVWAALRNEGVFETNDGGNSWLDIGLDGRPINWLAADNGGVLSRSPDTLTLYAGVIEDGISRRTVRGAPSNANQGDGWTTSAGGLPEHSTVLAFAADPRTPGTLWAARDGGGVYRSTDGGTSWSKAGAQVGDNLARSLSIDYSSPGGLLMGTANAGVWALRAVSAPQALPSSIRGAKPAVGAIDGRIEVVWPHDWAPVTEAKQANIGLRLFVPGSLVPPPCTWAPEVKVWQALDSGPAQPLGVAIQRTVEGQLFPYWDVNDVDVHATNDPQHKLYFMIQVSGINATGTGIWAHAADPRTYFPQQDVPSGITAETVEALDARIEIVWPHDEAGNPKPVSEGNYANVVVELFEHGTRLSVSVDWEPAGLTLYGAWNQEIGKPLARQAVMQVRQSGAITYPIWEFQNIPVAAATNPTNKLYLWVMVAGVTTYPTIWTHGADARTFFPVQDEPIQGCIP